MKILRTDATNQDFVTLVKQLDSYLTLVDGDDHEFYHQFNGIETLNNVILVYINQKAVGCGAFKPLHIDAVEIKRMFTLPEMRGAGIASKVLGELELWGKELGYNYSVLETGKCMQDAVRFYTKKGYKIIPNYGQYKEIENSICFRKKLK